MEPSHMSRTEKAPLSAASPAPPATGGLGLLPSEMAGRSAAPPPPPVETSDPVPQRNPHIEEIGNSARKLVDESRGLVTDAVATLDVQGHIERHPYRTLLVVAGVGYVLGGGLFTSFTSSLLRTGIRVAALPMVRSQLMNLAESAFSVQGPVAEAESKRTV